MPMWKKGRGALGPLKPLIGRWTTTAAAMPEGSEAKCSRDFAAFGAGFVRLDAAWEMGPRGIYQEIAIFGKGDDDTLVCWSFTNDGKRSMAVSCDATDVHSEAIGFVAEMPAGTARSVYWPNGDGFYFAVESKVKKGWNRFLLHRYHQA